MNLGTLIRAEFIERLNRFVCSVNLRGTQTKVLLRNTGRLAELLKPGAEVFLREKNSGKYSYELVLVRYNGELVCVDSHLPPKLLVEYLKKTSYPWEMKECKQEFSMGGSRFDLLLNNKVLIETKSVNLVRDRVAVFPDAPTKRGLKHIMELSKTYPKYEPAVVFVIQRADADKFSPNWDTDPKFSKALLDFYRQGFKVFAFLCKVSTNDIHISREIPLLLES